MGRTKRNRNRKISHNFQMCDESNEVVLLNSWLSLQGTRRNEKLSLAIFDDTGRGVLCKKKIAPGEELLNLPLNTTINVSTLLLDLNFCNIFTLNSKQCISEFAKSVTFQSLMAFYITYLKVQENKCKWFVYLQSLPKEYSVPYFLSGELKQYVDLDIQTVITKQKTIVDTSFNIFEIILQNTTSQNINVNKLQSSFNVALYEWAYFTVNTRCVYMDLSKVLDLKNVKNSILNLISDNTRISLCPYLDMINHSPNARNETKLLVGRDLENLNVTQLSEDLFSDVWFSIYTKNSFDPYTQVFICYGDSHNLKLVTEYGFYLPANDLDYVSFDYEKIMLYLESQAIKLSQEQTSFISSHGLTKDLYIDFRGLSFNFYGLLMVIKYYYNKNMDVSRLIYSAAICSNDRIIIDFITPMVREKIFTIKESISKLETYENGCVLSNCVALMQQYVNILEKFIKC